METKDQIEFISKYRNFLKKKWESNNIGDVKFDYFYNYKDKIGQRIELLDGVEIEFLEINEYYFVCKCWMTKPLGAHFHSDFIKEFICINGEMIDSLNKSIRLNKGNRISYHKYEKHAPEPLGACELLMIGYKN